VKLVRSKLLLEICEEQIVLRVACEEQAVCGESVPVRSGLYVEEVCVDRQCRDVVPGGVYGCGVCVREERTVTSVV
jgi:hypothetical protein